MILKYLSSLLRHRAPGQLIIQYSNHCNATCPQCTMRVSNRFSRSRLAWDQATAIVEHAAKSGFLALSLTGGEPLLHGKEVLALLNHAAEQGIPFTRTGTNGFVFMDHLRPDYAERVRELATSLRRSKVYTFWISIDSALPSVHERMRGLPGVIAGIQKALPIFHECGVYPSVNLGLNRNTGQIGRLEEIGEERFFANCCQALADFYQFVIDLGFTIVNVCYPMSAGGLGDNGDAVYGAVADSEIMDFSARERALLFKALSKTIPAYRAKIRIFTPLSALHLLAATEGVPPAKDYGCRGGIDFFFIDAESGKLYPCGYRGKEGLGEFTRFDLKAVPEEAQAHCTQCDWECFRDPSILFGPLLELFSRPLRAVAKLFAHPGFFRLWLADVRYYRACRFFRCTTPPNYKAMARVAKRHPAAKKCKS
jgi:MoaA/NifB/PqqE/SkfB family radical SAM enzyme